MGRRGVELWLARIPGCLSLVGLDVLSGGCARGIPYWVFFVVLYPSSHREPAPRTELTDPRSREVLHIEPGVLPGSIPEPSDLEHESLLVIEPLSDKVVEDSLNRFTGR